MPKDDAPKVVATTEKAQISAPVEKAKIPKILPKSTFTIRLDSSSWIVYNDPEDKTQNADTLRLYPDSTYTVNEFAWYFKEKYDEEGAYYWTYEGTYTIEGDFLNLYTNTGKENRNHTTLFISDTTLEEGRFRTYMKYDLITLEMKQKHRRIRSNLRNFMNAEGFAELNARINNVDDVISLFGTPDEVVGSLSEKIAEEDPYNTHTCLKYDGLTIQLIGSSLWLYEYSKPTFDIDSNITIGLLKDSVLTFLGEPGWIQYDDHSYSSDLSDKIIHTYVTGTLAAAATEHPYMELQNELNAFITYDETTARISKIRFEQVYIKPH